VRDQLHSETHDTPAEFSESTNSKPCMYANKCGHHEIDLEEDTYATVDTPIGELILCEEHMVDGTPQIMCGCGNDSIRLEHVGVWQWRTYPTVCVDIDNNLYNLECATGHGE
jgi:hypothetical protein